jgi:hypothetical protein
VQQSDDCRQVVFQPGRRADVAQGESSILERLEHSERFVEIKDEAGRDRIASAGFVSAHRASLLTPAGVVVDRRGASASPKRECPSTAPDTPAVSYPETPV